MTSLELFGVVDAAEEAGVTRPTIRKWIDEGLSGRHLAAVVYGGDLFIDPRELDLFLHYRGRLFSGDDYDDNYECVDDDYEDDDYNDKGYDDA